jgi:hypothetical protein
MKKLFKLIFISSIILLVSGCIFRNPFEDNEDSNKKTEKIIIFENRNDVDIYTDPATIKDARIEDDQLKLKVSYGGGCEKHEFKLFGSRLFMESNPLQAAIYLSHNSNGDLCKALLSKELIFDISPLKETCLQMYVNVDSIMLRIYEPGVESSVQSLVVYRF